jgi:hypothetical protein
MHGHVYSSRDGIRVIPPYGEGAYDYTKGNTRKGRMENIASAVALMLADYADQVRQDARNRGTREVPRLWWEHSEYTIVIHEEVERGTYTYHVHKDGE